MKKHVFIIIVAIFCFACKTRQKQESAETKSINVNESNSIFLSKTINDTLIQFVNSIDSIPNPYNAPVMYIVICEKNKKDTTLRFYAYPGLLEAVDIDTNNNEDKKISFKVIGGKQVKNKPVIIYSDGFNNLDGLVYKDSLSIDFVNENDFFNNYHGELYFWSYYPITEWLYKLTDKDSLVLLYKQKGKHEK
jgi:hypothetical protein